MIMIICYKLHFFIPYVIFDQQIKITFRNSSAPQKKSAPPFLLTHLFPLLFANIENCLGPPAERGEDTMISITKYVLSSYLDKYLEKSGFKKKCENKNQTNFQMITETNGNGLLLTHRSQKQLLEVLYINLFLKILQYSRNSLFDKVATY